RACRPRCARACSSPSSPRGPRAPAWDSRWRTRSPACTAADFRFPPLRVPWAEPISASSFPLPRLVEPSMSIQRVLIVDDESLSREFLMEAVQALGCRADAVPDGSQALERLRSRSYDLLITDLRMPGIDGLELIKQALSASPGLPTVLLTAFGTI